MKTVKLSLAGTIARDIAHELVDSLQSSRRTSTLSGATYGEMVRVCEAFDISRTASFGLKKSGLLPTFRIPGCKSNFVMIKDVEALSIHFGGSAA